MTGREPDDKPKDASGSGLSAFGIVAILIMLGMLGWAGWYAVQSWNAMSGVKMSPLGWVFMAMGAVVRGVELNPRYRGGQAGAANGAAGVLIGGQH